MITWRCGEGIGLAPVPRCPFEVQGSDRDAAEHFEQEGCWTHWIYEFEGFVPTGRSIHTSDAGGYYLDDGDPNDIADMFANRRRYARSR